MVQCDPLVNHKISLMSYYQPLEKKNSIENSKCSIQQRSSLMKLVSSTDTYVCVGTECEHISYYDLRQERLKCADPDHSP